MLAACVGYVALALAALYIVWLAKYKPAKPSAEPSLPPARLTKLLKFNALVRPHCILEATKREPVKEIRQPRFVEDGSFVINFKSTKPQRQCLSQLDANTIEFSPVNEQGKLNPEARDFCPKLTN